MEWITENAPLISYILIPAFTLALVIIAILAFRRAKETILQPFRSEVVKRQAQRMTELLELVSATQESDPIDYYGLCSLNVFMWMDEYGFVFKDHAKMREHCQSVFNGFIITKTLDSPIYEFKLPESIMSPSQNTSDDNLKEYRRQRYEKAKADGVDINDIDKIFLTKRFYEYQRRLFPFMHDPLLPSKILDVIDDFNKSINHNVKDILRSTIAEFITSFFTESSKTTTKLKIDPNGVYNMFNRKHITHTVILESLRNNIRDYLKVDSIP